VNEWKGLKELGFGLIEALCMQLLGETEENNEISKSEESRDTAEV
jgi:hypothetical protein